MIKYPLLFIILIMNVACNQVSPRLQDSKEIYLTTLRWGETELQELSKKMVQNILLSKEIALLKEKTYTFGMIRNDTHDQIDTIRVQSKITQGLLESDKFTFIEKGKANYIFQGKISSIFKKNATTKDMFFNFNLALIDTETSIILWSEDIEIRKMYQRPLLAW
ncbi:MAG TPA: hypothetical protein ENK66_03545 [Arcobacter sp.]|nr:hypothetical protein [Arcobacter sp.]